MVKDDALLQKYVYIAFVVAAYWLVSILTVFVNKTLLTGDIVNVDAPLFITWFQCVISAVCCATLSQLSLAFPRVIRFPHGHPFNRRTFLRVVPVSILFTLMVATNNLCLKYVDVTFYYIGRSLTTVFNVIFSYVILSQVTSVRSLAFCAVIVCGFFLGVDQESVAGSFSLIGTFFGVLGSLTLSLYSIYTKRVLCHVNNEIWLLSYFNNVYSSVLFIPLIMANDEFRVVFQSPQVQSLTFWTMLSIGGLCGLAIGYFTALQIQVTSPLTHNVSGTAKACVQTFIAAVWYAEYKSALWWLSNFIVLGGSAGYARVKQLELEAKHTRDQSASKSSI